MEDSLSEYESAMREIIEDSIYEESEPQEDNEANDP